MVNNNYWIADNFIFFYILGVSSHARNMEPVGEPLKSVAKAPKVKLEISSGPAPPVLNYEPLPYGRRKKKRANDENGPKRVKLVISAKRLHPATKSNNILLEPLSEIQVWAYTFKHVVFLARAVVQVTVFM